MTLQYSYKDPRGIFVTYIYYIPEFLELTDQEKLEHWKLTWARMKDQHPKGTVWLSFSYPVEAFKTITNPEVKA